MYCAATGKEITGSYAALFSGNPLEEVRGSVVAKARPLVLLDWETVKQLPQKSFFKQPSDDKLGLWSGSDSLLDHFFKEGNVQLYSKDYYELAKKSVFVDRNVIKTRFPQAVEMLEKVTEEEERRQKNLDYIKEGLGKSLQLNWDKREVFLQGPLFQYNLNGKYREHDFNALSSGENLTVGVTTVCKQVVDGLGYDITLREIGLLQEARISYKVEPSKENSDLTLEVYVKQKVTEPRDVASLKTVVRKIEQAFASAKRKRKVAERQLAYLDLY